MNKSRFKHDCQFCHYLGVCDDCDLYFCKSPKMNNLYHHSSLVARYGNKPSEHTSCPYQVEPHCHELFMAKKYSIEQGFLKEVSHE